MSHSFLFRDGRGCREATGEGLRHAALIGQVPHPPLRGTFSPGRRKSVHKIAIDHSGSKAHLYDFDSLSRRARLRATPQRYPERAPSLRTTRWQGMAIAIALAAQAWATARTALGLPIF